MDDRSTTDIQLKIVRKDAVRFGRGYYIAGSVEHFDLGLEQADTASPETDRYILLSANRVESINFDIGPRIETPHDGDGLA